MNNRRRPPLLARVLATFLLVFLVAVAACQRKASVPPDVIARVNDRMLTLADFKRYLEKNAGADLSQVTAEVSSALLDQYLEEIIISEFAARRGVEVPAERIAAAVRTEAGVTVVEKRDELRREKLIADLAAEASDPTETEIRAFYERHAAEFRSGEAVRVRQILVRDEDLAKEILRKLRSGVPFAELSAEHSLAPNAKRGGEIGFVSRGELPTMFEEEIFRLNAGEISEVISTDSTQHLFQVDERRPAGMLTLEEAAPLIEARLREDAVRDALAKLVARSRREMNVAVLTRRLPFRYSGAFPKSEAE